MRISKHIHLAASGAAGFSLTDALDCNTWLIDTGDGLALFDTGAGRDIGALLAEVEAGGLDAAELRHIFLTHAHADHSGGACALLERLPGVTLHAGRETADRMASNDENRISLDRARHLGVYPSDYRWRGVTVGNVLGDAEGIEIGRARIQLIATPGHSDDHCAFLVRIDDSASLIAGDAVFAGGKIILQDIPDCSVAASLDSIRRLASLEFESFLPGHGVFSVQNGMRHVAKGRDYADTGLAPPPFFSVG
jgi:hydroxyacylglutathione hydrolase